jgi:hypothetical protein
VTKFLLIAATLIVMSASPSFVRTAEPVAHRKCVIEALLRNADPMRCAVKTSNADGQHATMICDRYPRGGRARGQCSVVSRAALDSQRSRISCSRMFGSGSVPR